MCQPVVRGHADEGLHSCVNIVIFGVGRGEVPVGFRSKGEVGDIVIFDSVIARNDGAALSIGGQALHGTHTDGFKQQFWLEAGFCKEAVDDSTQGRCFSH